MLAVGTRKKWGKIRNQARIYDSLIFARFDVEIKSDNSILLLQAAAALAPIALWQRVVALMKFFCEVNYAPGIYVFDLFKKKMTRKRLHILR